VSAIPLRDSELFRTAGTSVRGEEVETEIGRSATTDCELAFLGKRNAVTFGESPNRKWGIGRSVIVNSFHSRSPGVQATAIKPQYIGYTVLNT